MEKINNVYKEKKEFDYNKPKKEFNYNDIIGTPTDRALMDLEIKLGEVMAKFSAAMKSQNNEEMVKYFSEASRISEDIKYLKAIQMKERGLSYKTDFGTECYSLEQLNFWNSWYNDMMSEKEKTASK